MSKVGLHLRIDKRLQETIEKALRLKLPFFQNFLLAQATGGYLSLTYDDKKAFIHAREQFFNELFLHGSYWINAASASENQKRLLKKELRLASDLTYSHYVLHPGSARGCTRREDGIDNLARILSDAIKQFPSITFVLENTAHGNMSIGSDLHDFYLLLEKLDHPERIAFCIDTAHAHAFGYDLACAQQETFFDTLKKLGPERIAIVHLNDTSEKHGSKLDKHECLGRGVIGEEALQAFISHEMVRDLPIMLELPELGEEEECEQIEKVIRWRELINSR